MDNLAETGSRWFCLAAHQVGAASFEVQTCGAGGSRYAVGVATIAALALLGVLAAWLGLERRYGAG